MVATETDGSHRASRLPCEYGASRWIIGAQAGGNRQRRRTVIAGRSDRDPADPRAVPQRWRPGRYGAGFKDRFPI